MHKETKLKIYNGDMLYRCKRSLKTLSLTNNFNSVIYLKPRPVTNQSVLRVRM